MITGATTKILDMVVSAATVTTKQLEETTEAIVPSHKIVPVPTDTIPTRSSERADGVTRGAVPLHQAGYDSPSVSLPHLGVCQVFVTSVKSPGCRALPAHHADDRLRPPQLEEQNHFPHARRQPRLGREGSLDSSLDSSLGSSLGSPFELHAVFLPSVSLRIISATRPSETDTLRCKLPRLRSPGTSATFHRFGGLLPRLNVPNSPFTSLQKSSLRATSTTATKTSTAMTMIP